ncbi:MAG: agmatine deiminase family protein [Chitinophagales bacterium]|nr:agmatine deiminase family protein [Chitinophagales bacterium]
MKRRLPAEWEKQSAVQLTFPHKNSDWAPYIEQVIPCFIAIAESISQFQKVLIVCDNLSEVKSYLQHIPEEQILFVEIPSNDTWARDHGAITIEEDGDLTLLDFIFNGWGLKFAADKDNLINYQLFEKEIFKTNALFKVGMVLEGGGIESDGKGIIMTTSACQLSPNRNPHLNTDDIEENFKELFGAEKVLWLNHGYLAGDDTDSHIDTLARFCNEQTIAYVKCKDEKDEHFEELKAMEDELKSFTNLNNIPYQLVELPMPDACYDEEGKRIPATYANFTIINEAVLVPIYGVQQDEEALSIIQTIFPDRKVIGINCFPLILQHGSLHCVTMQYPEGVI